MSVSCVKLDFFTFFNDFCKWRFRYTIASILKENIAASTVFLLAKICFPNGYAFFCINIKKTYRRFFGTSAEITAFRWKIAAVNLNSQQNFFDNGASVVLRRSSAVSAELPAILESSLISIALRKFLVFLSAVSSFSHHSKVLCSFRSLHINVLHVIRLAPWLFSHFSLVSFKAVA